MKIYVATDGEYSDYGIINVFLDKNIAEPYCELHGYNLEEYDTFDENVNLEDWYWYVVVKVPIAQTSIEIIPNRMDITCERVASSINRSSNTRFISPFSSRQKNFYLHIYRKVGDKLAKKENLVKTYTNVALELSKQIQELIKVQGWTPKMVDEWLVEKEK